MEKSNKKRCSILKRPNYEESSPTQPVTKSTRRISFSGKKSIKEFIAGEDKATIWGTSYEESADGLLVPNITIDHASTTKEVITTSNQVSNGMLLRSKKVVTKQVKKVIVPEHDKENIMIPMQYHQNSDMELSAETNENVRSVQLDPNYSSHSLNISRNMTINETVEISLNTFELAKLKFKKPPLPMPVDSEAIANKGQTVMDSLLIQNTLDVSPDFYCSFFTRDDEKEDLIADKKMRKEIDKKIITNSEEMELDQMPPIPCKETNTGNSCNNQKSRETIFCNETLEDEVDITKKEELLGAKSKKRNTLYLNESIKNSNNQIIEVGDKLQNRQTILYKTKLADKENINGKRDTIVFSNDDDNLDISLKSSCQQNSIKNRKTIVFGAKNCLDMSEIQKENVLKKINPMEKFGNRQTILFNSTLADDMSKPSEKEFKRDTIILNEDKENMIVPITVNCQKNLNDKRKTIFFNSENKLDISECSNTVPTSNEDLDLTGVLSNYVPMDVDDMDLSLHQDKEKVLFSAGICNKNKENKERRQTILFSEHNELNISPVKNTHITTMEEVGKDSVNEKQNRRTTVLNVNIDSSEQDINIENSIQSTINPINNLPESVTIWNDEEDMMDVDYVTTADKSVSKPCNRRTIVFGDANDILNDTENEIIEDFTVPPMSSRQTFGFDKENIYSESKSENSLKVRSNNPTEIDLSLNMEEDMDTSVIVPVIANQYKNTIIDRSIAPVPIPDKNTRRTIIFNKNDNLDESSFMVNNESNNIVRRANTKRETIISPKNISIEDIEANGLNECKLYDRPNHVSNNLRLTEVFDKDYMLDETVETLRAEKNRTLSMRTTIQNDKQVDSYMQNPATLSNEKSISSVNCSNLRLQNFAKLSNKSVIEHYHTMAPTNIPSTARNNVCNEASNTYDDMELSLCVESNEICPEYSKEMRNQKKRQTILFNEHNELNISPQKTVVLKEVEIKSNTEKKNRRTIVLNENIEISEENTNVNKPPVKTINLSATNKSNVTVCNDDENVMDIDYLTPDKSSSNQQSRRTIVFGNANDILNETEIGNKTREIIEGIVRPSISSHQIPVFDQENNISEARNATILKHNSTKIDLAQNSTLNTQEDLDISIVLSTENEIKNSVIDRSVMPARATDKNIRRTIIFNKDNNLDVSSDTVNNARTNIVQRAITKRKTISSPTNISIEDIDINGSNEKNLHVRPKHTANNLRRTVVFDKDYILDETTNTERNKTLENRPTKNTTKNNKKEETYIESPAAVRFEKSTTTSTQENSQLRSHSYAKVSHDNTNTATNIPCEIKNNIRRGTLQFTSNANDDMELSICGQDNEIRLRSNGQNITVRSINNSKKSRQTILFTQKNDLEISFTGNDDHTSDKIIDKNLQDEAVSQSIASTSLKFKPEINLSDSYSHKPSPRKASFQTVYNTYNAQPILKNDNQSIIDLEDTFPLIRDAHHEMELSGIKLFDQKEIDKTRQTFSSNNYDETMASESDIFILKSPKISENFENNSPTFANMPKLFKKITQDSILSVNPKAIDASVNTNTTISPNTTAALCNIDMNKITADIQKQNYDSDTTIGCESIMLSDSNDCIEKTRLSLINSISLDSTVEDVCEASRILVLGNKENHNYPDNYSMKNMLEKNSQSLCRKCKNCQRAIDRNDTTIDGFVLESAIPYSPELNFDGYKRLLDKPTFKDVLLAHKERRESNNFNASHEESILLPIVPPIDFLMDNYSEGYQQLLEENDSSRKNVGAIFPLIPSFEYLFCNKLRSEKTDWNLNDLHMPVGILEFRHNHIKSIRLLFQFSPDALVTSTNGKITFEKITILKYDVNNNLTPFDSIVQTELLTRVPCNLITFCSTSNDLFYFLNHLHIMCVKAFQIGKNLLKTVIACDGFLEKNESENCFVRKSLRNKFNHMDKPLEFCIRIRNIEKICHEDIILPPRCYFNDCINSLPTGLDFIISFLSDPVKYLK